MKLPTITVVENLPAPPDKLFEVLCDYENYHRITAAKSRLVRRGTQEKNGVGAVRELRAGSAWFHEEIVGFKRPQLIEYRVIASRPAIEHDIGRICLEPWQGGTRATWTTTLRISTPLIGVLLTPLFMRQLRNGFSSTLKAASDRALAA
jgi:hypothetical protein